MTVRLNIGCGKDFRESWCNLDVVKQPQFRPGLDIWGHLEAPLRYMADETGESVPVPDDTFDEMIMRHVIEHLKDPLVAMQELWRVAKPNCKLEVSCPYGSSDDAFEDPTHYRQYFIGSWYYFQPGAYHKADYGYRGDWHLERLVLRCRPEAIARLNRPDALRVLMRDRNVVVEQIATLRAIKPRREVGSYEMRYVNPEIISA